MHVRQHFKFTYNPFEREIASEFLYESSEFQEALARLLYSCQKRAMMVLTGEIGAGKSTLLRLLESKLDKNQYLFIYIADSQLTPRNFYISVLSKLGVQPPSQLTKLKGAFKTSMMDLFESKRKTPVIAVDEAQALELSMLQELRFILNFGIDSYSPLGLILAGEPQFRSMIRTPHMAPIWRRVETSYHLVGMSLEETKNYINHQTKAAGCEHPLFPEDVTAKIHERAKGIPALVNILCKGCLQDAAGREQTLISGENVNRVLQEWQ
jgi:type II secretory pathway predicted ATPase ExeA